MPQLLAIAILGVAVWFVGKAVRREMSRVGEQLRRDERKKAERQVTALEQDEDGVYRPRGDD
jgi:type IV secretory pathway TrbD component